MHLKKNGAGNPCFAGLNMYHWFGNRGHPDTFHDGIVYLLVLNDFGCTDQSFTVPMDGNFLLYTQPVKLRPSEKKHVAHCSNHWQHLDPERSELTTCFFGHPDFVPSFYFLFSTNFGLYAKLSARMQWSRNQKRLRTISPAAGMVAATQPAVGATLVLRQPGKEPWKPMRGHKELGEGRDVSILQHPVWNSYAGIWMITKKHLAWWNDWFSLNYLGIWYSWFSDAFLSAVHRFANAFLAIGASGWNEEGRVGSVGL